MRGLAAERPRTTWIVWAFAAVGIAAWSIWLTTAHVKLYAVAVEAHLEAADGALRVTLPVGGQVTASYAQLGAQVSAGQTLLQLDTTEAGLAAAEAKGRLLALQSHARQIEQEIRSREAMRIESQQAAEAEVEVARTHSDEALATLEFAQGRQLRLASLAKAGSATDAEVSKATAEANALAAQQKGWILEVLRLGLSAKSADRRVESEIEGLKGDLTDTTNEIQVANSQHALAVRAFEQRTVRAATAGTIGDIAAVQTGSYIEAGTNVLTLIPAGELMVSADFDEEAIGEIRAGLAAVVHLRSGLEERTIAATVAAVSTASGDGRLHVELSIDDPTSLASATHGQQVSAEVTLRETSPARVVLASIGLGGTS
ncbi:MAG: HlyD family efflux transporter periplasmic adaptor subunit [Devosia sp.]